MSASIHKGLETSIDYCRRALKRDPNYALAYVGLGRCYHVLGPIHRGLRQTQAEASEQYHRALAIDASLAETHTGLACLRLMHDWDWSAAKAELEQALAIDPAEANAWEIDCFRLAALGRLPEAYASIQHGLELDPLSARTSDVLAMCLNWMRQYDRAIAETQRMLGVDPNFPLAYQNLGLA